MNDIDLLALREEQKLWEVEAVERGIRRYRNEANKALSSGNEADTPPGQRMMIDVVGHLAQAIERAQAEGMESVKIERSRGPAWAHVITLLDAEKLAYITARSILSSSQSSRPASGLAMAIGTKVRLEIEFEQWKKAEAAKAKASEGEYVSMFERLRRKMPTASTRTVQRWMRKCDEYRKIEWPQALKIALGNKLIHLAVSEGGGWFTTNVERKSEGGRYTTSIVVRLTDKAREFLNYHHAESELSRPWMLPMLCPPNPWQTR